MKRGKHTLAHVMTDTLVLSDGWEEEGSGASGIQS